MLCIFDPLRHFAMLHKIYVRPGFFGFACSTFQLPVIVFFIVFLSAFIICIPPSTRIAHLQVFPRHIGTHKITGFQVAVEQFKNLCTAFGSNSFIFEPPVFTNFAFVRFANQYALFALAYPV